MIKVFDDELSCQDLNLKLWYQKPPFCRLNYRTINKLKVDVDSLALSSIG